MPTYRSIPFVIAAVELIGCAHPAATGRSASTAIPATTPVVGTGSTTGTVAQPLSANNPFANASTLPFQAPPFDRIRAADYQP